VEAIEAQRPIPEGIITDVTAEMFGVFDPRLLKYVPKVVKNPRSLRRKGKKFRSAQDEYRKTDSRAAIICPKQEFFFMPRWGVIASPGMRVAGRAMGRFGGERDT